MRHRRRVLSVSVSRDSSIHRTSSQPTLIAPRPRLRRIVALLLLCVALTELIPAPQALAGGASDFLDDFLGDWESQLTTTTPGFYEGQRRGYVFGGSARFRAPIIGVSPLSIQLPRITSGCGGINFFGGSFSFINMDRFTEYLQAIAQNAIGMAFDMALTTLCPQCATVLHKLEDTIQKVNAMSSNSCQAARSLINMAGGTPEAIRAYRVERCKALETEFNQVTDWFGGHMECNENTGQAEWKANQQARAAQSDTTKPPVPLLEQNIFWKAWVKSGIQISQDFNTTGEDFMSLYGTLVLYFDDNKKQKLDYKAPKLEVTDLLGGWQQKKGWICADGHTDCLKVEEGNLQTYTGLTVTVEEKLKAYAIELRTRQRFDLANNPYFNTPVAGVPIYRLLVNTAEIPGGNDYIAEKGARWIALDLLDSFTRQMAHYLYSQLVTEDEQGLRKQFIEDFNRRRQEITQQLAYERHRLSQDLADLKFLNDIANGGGTRTASDFVRQVIFAKTIQNSTNLVGR